MDYCVMFNRKLAEFADDLSANVDPEFQSYKVMLNLTVTVDKTIPSRMFYDNLVVPYEHDIADKNDKVFLMQNYETMGADMGIVTKLKNMWHTLDADNREAVWKYMQLLTAISKKCQVSRTLPTGS
jgi:hypothetical protein